MGLSSRCDELRDEILATVDRVFRSGRLILGQEGVKFEWRWRDIWIADGVGVNSGTDAIYIARAALGVKPATKSLRCLIRRCRRSFGDPHPRRKAGLFDVRDDDFLMDVDQIEAAIASPVETPFR